jgi:molecular chaperone DnaJ
MIVKQVQTDFGQMVSRSTCRACGGTGKTTQQPCPTCGGKALQSVVRAVNVTIPACTDNGAQIRIVGAGDAGSRGGAAGDLIVKVNVRKHPRFERRGCDVCTEEEVSYLDAIFGTDLQVHTLHGIASLKIPPGTQSGQELRLHGHGAPKGGTSKGKGDHVVRVKVKLPTQLSAAEKEALEKLRGLSK